MIHGSLELMGHLRLYLEYQEAVAMMIEIVIVTTWMTKTGHGFGRLVHSFD
jgi:hypothetical protein